jgi:hypothetical protein
MVDSLNPSAATLAFALAGQVAPAPELVEAPEQAMRRTAPRPATIAEEKVPPSLESA